MKSTKSHAMLIRLIRRMQGRYAFSVKEIANCLHVSRRSAERYMALLKLLDIVEFRYRDTDQYMYYRIRKTECNWIA
jgi:predicted DNA-binding transcriptional regulator YafY